MLPAPKPPTERQRLASLRSLNILDTPREERFDRITRLARRIFNVPIALVSLVDSERQWFKSRQGLGPGVCETPRDISFCGHTILSSNTLVVQNATEDERFRDNPLVTGELHIRFYAGYPLTSPDGSTLGSLCIIDRVARSLSDEDTRMLTTLGQMVEAELAAANLSTNDSLTGLYNWRGLQEIGRHTLAVTRQFGHMLHLMVVKLVGLDELRSRDGALDAEQILVEIAQVLQMGSRESDLVARTGDEFCALFPRAEGTLRTPMLERIQATVAQFNSQRQGSSTVAVSIQSAVVSFDPERHHAIDDMVTEAEVKITGGRAPARAPAAPVICAIPVPAG